MQQSYFVKKDIVCQSAVISVLHHDVPYHNLVFPLLSITFVRPNWIQLVTLAQVRPEKHMHAVDDDE